MKNTINLAKIYFKETLTNSFSRSSKRSGAKNALIFVFLFIFVAVCLGYSLYNLASMQISISGSANGIIIIGLMMSTYGDYDDSVRYSRIFL